MLLSVRVLYCTVLKLTCLWVAIYIYVNNIYIAVFGRGKKRTKSVNGTSYDLKKKCQKF